MNYYLQGRMKSLMYAKRSNSRAELINRIMHAADQIRNDQQMVMKAVMSTVKRAQMCVDNQDGHFVNAYLTYSK
jgi:hypothetical protein